MSSTNSLSSSAARGAQALEQADVALGERLGGERHHPVVRALGQASELADQPQLFALCAGILAWGLLAGEPRRAEAGGRMLASFLLATAVKGLVKRLVARTRPHLLLDEGRYEVEPMGPNEGPWNSFPSGHTAGSVAAARALVRCYPGARWPAYAAAGAVGLVQVPRGAHYPVDVAAGLLVGLGSEALVNEAAERLQRAAAGEAVGGR